MTEGDTPLPSPSASTEAKASTGAKFVPTPPKMGGLKEHSEDVFLPWTGGKPNFDWTSLAVTNPDVIAPNQYRQTSVGGAIKSQYYRTMGLSTKFTRDSDLLTFQKKMMQHLEEYGMDTTTYLPDPTDPTQMISIITHHARFTLAEASTAESTQLKSYDEYDKSNIKDSVKFLLESVDEDLETQMYENCKADETFIVHWTHLMLIIGTVSIDRFDKIKDRIKSRKIQDYSGENVSLLCSDYLADWKLLHGAKMYDNNLTMVMVKSIMQTGNEDFRDELRSIKKKLDKKLLSVRHLSYDEASHALITDSLDVMSILRECKEAYRTEFDDGNWPAAMNTRDSRALSRSYGTVQTATDRKLLKLLASALEQRPNLEVRDKSKDKCNNCGEFGHWASNCPKKQQGGRNNRPQGGRGQHAQNRGGPNRGNRVKGPLVTPPKNGESEIKLFPDGKRRYWCSKCGRWTLSHGTANHKGKDELQAARQPQSTLARVNLQFHPSAFTIVGTISSHPNLDLSTSSVHTRTFATKGVLFDSGANCCLTNDTGDFIGSMVEMNDPRATVDGIGKSLKVEGIGNVSWTFKSDDGGPRTLKLPAYYAPSCVGRIASTSQILKTYPSERIVVTTDSLKLEGDPSVSSITVPVCSTSSLPIAELAAGPFDPGHNDERNLYAVTIKQEKPDPTKKIKSSPSLVSGINLNLSEPEKELLRWHY
jgi:hypothetical protein